MSESQLKQLHGMQKFLEQALLHIGIYQSVVGDLPADVVHDVVAALPKTAVYNTPAEFIAAVRDTAARLAQIARQKAAEVPMEGQSSDAARSPYSGPVGGSGIPPASLDIVRNARANMPPPPPQSPLIILPGTK